VPKRVQIFGFILRFDGNSDGDL